MRRANLGRSLFSFVLLALAGFAVHRICVMPFRDNLILRDIEERTALMENADAFQAISMARLNLAELDRVAHSSRLDPAWYMLRGTNYEALDRWPEAASAYTDALAIDQRPEIYFSRGLAMLHLGRIAEAEADMVTAVRFNAFFLEKLSGELRTRVAVKAGLP